MFNDICSMINDICSMINEIYLLISNFKINQSSAGTSAGLLKVLIAIAIKRII